MSVGKKDDATKRRYTLLPWAAVEQVVDVLDFGAKKYGEENWRHVESWRDRYTNAALRHIVAYAQGERFDRESGRPHLAHAVCSLLFVLALDCEEVLR